jgi:acetyltransferase AlgX (SGNH hydrolase-like protein)
MPGESSAAPRSSLRKLLPPLALLLGVPLWLALTARAPTDNLRRFFGLWRTQHILLALGALWLAAALLLGARARKALFAYLLGTFTLVAGWMLLEIVGLVGVVNYPKLFGQTSEAALGSVAVPHLDLQGTTYEDTAPGWGLDARPIPFHYRTDQRGFRNAVDRDGADLYLLGDSLLVAGLIPFEQTLAARLETALGRPVMNIALIAKGPEDERDMLAKARVPMKGSTVLHFIFEGNDLADSMEYAARRAQGGGSPRPSLAKRTLVYNLLMKAQRWTSPQSPLAPRQTCRIGDQRVTFCWTAATMRCEACERQIDPVLQTLAATRRDVEAAGGKYAVVLVPDKLRVLGPRCAWPPESTIRDWKAELSRLPDVLAAWSREQHVEFIDLTAPLSRAAESGPSPWFAGDTHWNARGTEVAAATLGAWPFLAKAPGPQAAR